MKARLVAGALLALLLSGCGTFSGNTKQSSVQAIVTTTRTVKLLVTTAAIAADAGVINEAAWKKIAAASIDAGNGLQAWSDAIRANKDTAAYQLVVAQALAIIEALLPVPKHSDLSPFTLDDVGITVSRLLRPHVYRFAGGVS